ARGDHAAVHQPQGAGAGTRRRAGPGRGRRGVPPRRHAAVAGHRSIPPPQRGSPPDNRPGGHHRGPAGSAKGGPTVTAVLEMRRVSKVYGAPPVQVRALVDADLTVRSGEMVAVMGPSGSGKSTLLAIAGTLQTPTDGEVRVAGRP